MEVVDANELSPLFEGGPNATKQAASYLNAAGIHHEITPAPGGDGGS